MDTIVDLLTELKLPLWSVLVIILFGWIIMKIFLSKLDKKKNVSILTLEKQLDFQKFEKEKFLELLQTRHTQKIQALDEINYLILEFKHSVDHITWGHYHYENRLKEFYDKARTHTRKFENILGNDFYKAVLELTDAGFKILRTNIIVTDATLEKLENQKLPKPFLQSIAKSKNIPIPIQEGDKIFSGLDKKLVENHKRDTYYALKFEDFDSMELFESGKKYENLRKKIQEEIPRLKELEL